MIQRKDQTQFYYHIVKNNSVILSNLPDDLLPEVNDSLAEAKLINVMFEALRNDKRNYL